MNTLKNFINNFKIALQNKKRFFITKHKFLLVKIFQFLYLKGFIKNYEIKDICLMDKYEDKKKIRKKIILVHLFTSPMTNKIIDIHSSFTKVKQNITYQELLNNNRKDFVILLTTDMGLMTDTEAIKYKKGGLILCIFEIK